MKEVVISRADLAKLPEYSMTLPTGPKVGFRWRCNVHEMRSDRKDAEPEWAIAITTDIGSDRQCGIEWAWAVEEPGKVHRGELNPRIKKAAPQ